MYTKPKHGLIKRIIAMLLVLTMTCVYVVGDNYAPLIANHGKYNSDDVLAQTLSYSTGLSPDTKFRDVSDLVLAENATNMGKASRFLSEAFAKMPKNVKSSDELDKSVADFSRQIAELKTQAIDDLLNIETPLFQASTIMSEISTLINPEKPYVSLADNLPFNDVSEENITYSTADK